MCVCISIPIPHLPAQHRKLRRDVEKAPGEDHGGDSLASPALHIYAGGGHSDPLQSWKGHSGIYL